MMSPHMPPLMEAIGIACVPVEGAPAGTLLARKPLAVAVITIGMRGDGHCDANVAIVSDTRPLEFPLPVIIEEQLAIEAPTVASNADVQVLTLDATARRFFVEPRLARLARGEGLIDPVAMFGSGADERGLCHRLGIPLPTTGDAGVARSWAYVPAPAEEVALMSAASRLMLWAQHAAFVAAEPDPFFEPLLALRERLFELERGYPGVKALIDCAPMMTAVSFASDYQAYRARRDAGDEDARWVRFEDGLFHS